MFGHRIKIPDELYERLRQAAQAAGYASVEEFVLHILEKATAEVEDAHSEEEVRKRLKGLGYLE